ncbi:MAG TPA: VPA1269 family protein [Thiopseudomonas sp.]|nr:VPA1269 family protein [Thiopseudomonas sp.]
MQKKQFYKTLSEAKLAAQQLGIQSSTQYDLRYKEDPGLPSTPRKYYHEDWLGWLDFLGKPSPDWYATYQEARAAVQQLGIQSSEQYKEQHKKDPKLPSTPYNVYSHDWVDWYDFLGKPSPDWYATYQEARKAVQQLGIQSSDQYKEQYKKDPKLPSNPQKFYSHDWVDGYDFLGLLGKPSRYATYQEAREATQQLGIKSSTQYDLRYKEDPKLSSTPRKTYPNEWTNWYEFLGTALDFYEIYQEASEAAKQLNITTSTEYKNRYKEDPRLPCHPHAFYSHDWVDWYSFLGKPSPDWYATYQEARKAVQQLGIQSSDQYKEQHKKDPKLPSTPHRAYSLDWVDWYSFLGKPSPDRYATYQEAKKAVQQLGIQSSDQYKEYYKKDPKLPSTPYKAYSNDWTCWEVFLGTKRNWYSTYQEASKAAQQLGIRSVNQYKKRYKEDPKFPSNPNRVYSNDWINWGAFLGNTLIKKQPLAGAFYQFSKSCPAWKEAAEQHILENRSQTTRVSNIRALLNEVVIPVKMTAWPGELLNVNTPFPRKKYEDFVNNISESGKLARHNFCIDFFDWLLDRYCSEESDDGELVRLPDYRNPLVTLMSQLSSQLERYRPNESVKPVLPISIIVRARKHLIPHGSNFFSDLAALHPFLQDSWFAVDPSTVDPNDPDCVWREHTVVSKDNNVSNNKKVIQIWSPVKLIALYTLFMLPLRGQQICWLDSGEADVEIPISDGLHIKWVKNPLVLGKYQRRQGFVKKYNNDQLGMYVTTNKTSAVPGGYSVPFMPEDLAYWIIRLRDWQTKYNPVDAPTPWTQINLRQLINKNVLKARGSQTFLFRDPCGKDKTRRSPIYTTEAFSSSLPALLAAIQKPGEELAVVHKKYGFSSPFTPHSLRTSIITAYVIDGGAPVNVVMKLVGHHSLVMTLYYSKVGPLKMASELEEAEKRALQQNIDRLKDLAFTKKIENAKSQLVATDRNFLNNIDDQWPAAAYQFTDWGLCPMSGAGCDTGGALVLEGTRRGIYAPVESGYLGKRNCPRCRYFITGPAWLGGLQALFNEIILETNTVREEYHELESKKDYLENEKFDAEQIGQVFKQHRDLNQTIAILEERTHKLDMFLCDFQQVYSLIQQCIVLLKEGAAESDKQQQLIVSDSSVLEVALQESHTDFRLLASICRDAEFYQATSASRATPKMAQLIDTFADRNGFSPGLFKLSETQQRKAANQISNLLLTRLNGNWDLAEQVVTGNLQLSDLGIDELLEPLKLDITAALEGKLQQSLEVKYVGT